MKTVKWNPIINPRGLPFRAWAEGHVSFHRTAETAMAAAIKAHKKAGLMLGQPYEVCAVDVPEKKDRAAYITAYNTKKSN